MADFGLVWPVLLRLEGDRYTNDPDDRGGATRDGITLAEAIRCHLDLNGDGKVDAADVRLITPAVAEPYYRREWWNRLWCDRLEPQKVAENLFLFAVNHGPAGAVMELQRAAAQFGRAVSADGVMGPRTAAAVNEIDSGTLNALYALRIESYYRRAATAPGQDKFLGGWLSRIRR
jgi:lysozyme family protein